nr:hypothetical protein [Streptomyces katrae]
MSGSTKSPEPTERIRAAWRAAHNPVAGVARWTRVMAYAIPLLVLPSSLWRVATGVLHLPLDGGEAAHGTGSLPLGVPPELYVVFLSVLSEVLAFTAVGLVATWGEVFPTWLPGLRGRPVPTAAAVAPAAIGATMLTVLWTALGIAIVTGHTLRGDPLPSAFPTQSHDWRAALFTLCYAPVLLWGPLLAAVTAAYAWRRHRLRAVPTTMARSEAVLR